MTIPLSDAAQLSLAAYSILQKGPVDDQKTGLEAGGMASTQATEFAKRFPTVVTQYDDITALGGMGTGFNATIFMDVLGNLTLAIRGTDNLTGNDAATDLAILHSGAGYDQIVAMVNWWLRASAPEGQMVHQFLLAEMPLNAAPAGAVVIRSNAETSYVLDMAAGQAEGVGLVASDATLDVTGHSLGIRRFRVGPR